MFTLPTKFFSAWPTTLSAPFSVPFSVPFPASFPVPLSTPFPAELPTALPAEFVNAGRTFAETQLAGCNALMRAAFESGASLVELNVHATREGMAAASTVSNGLLFVREPRDLVCLTASQSQQALERAQRYGRQVAGVANTAQHRLGELSRDFAGSLPRNPIE
ncbi:phasin family protein [Pseudoduganella umbonata]|uniref:Phasin family protein n=1 Tax=Pseudoduganella umbonata TaxID=864828 RepID=A0A4V1EDY7_9BURK|nr:phasin family protein [Pseudoduganella umbonata]MBB3223869.1 phasin family protein [Pseudoduganella umbonata]QCP12721.1 phasin family protein [Pseudoduganella umbonata]